MNDTHSNATTAQQQVTHIPVTHIEAGNNDRQHFDRNALADLAASIRQHGLAQPITVRPLGEGRYQIVAGERRFRAIRDLLGWPTVPCLVRELSDEQAAAIMLAENTGRVDLNPIEEAEAYRARAEAFGWTTARIAEVAGVSEERVRDRLALLRLVPDIQHLVRFGHFPVGHARLLTDLDANRQRIALRLFNASSHMPLSRFKEVVNELLAAQNQESLFSLEDFFMQQVQEEPPVRRGKGARTGAPTRPDLPPVRTSSKDTAAQVIERYIYDLLEAGRQQEAGVLGNVYNALVTGNWMAIPDNSLLSKIAADEPGAPAELAPAAR
jgi:ParB family chromosome partitioning protein